MVESRACGVGFALRRPAMPRSRSRAFAAVGPERVARSLPWTTPPGRGSWPSGNQAKQDVDNTAVGE